jgi:hypothetical protein
MPPLPEGIDDPPLLLCLEKAAERGGALRVSSARLISDLYHLEHERDGSPKLDENGSLVYGHVPDDIRDDYAEAELVQRRQWCKHSNRITVTREVPQEQMSPGTVYCIDCKQRVEQP